MTAGILEYCGLDLDKLCKFIVLPAIGLPAIGLFLLGTALIILYMQNDNIPIQKPDKKAVQDDKKPPKRDWIDLTFVKVAANTSLRAFTGGETSRIYSTWFVYNKLDPTGWSIEGLPFGPNTQRVEILVDGVVHSGYIYAYNSYRSHTKTLNISFSLSFVEILRANNTLVTTMGTPLNPTVDRVNRLQRSYGIVSGHVDYGKLRNIVNR